MKFQTNFITRQEARLSILDQLHRVVPKCMRFWVRHVANAVALPFGNLKARANLRPKPPLDLLVNNVRFRPKAAFRVHV